VAAVELGQIPSLVQRSRVQGTIALLMLAALALAGGVAVYALVRAPGSAMAWPSGWALGASTGGAHGGHGAGHIIGVITGSLPSFAHAFAFALLSALLLPPSRARVAGACLFWAAIDSAFEVMQHPSLAGAVAQGLRESTQGMALADWAAQRTGAYLLAGTFDPLDLLAGVAGAMAAYAVCALSSRTRRSRVCEPDTYSVIGPHAPQVCATAPSPNGRRQAKEESSPTS